MQTDSAVYTFPAKYHSKIISFDKSCPRTRTLKLYTSPMSSKNTHTTSSFLHNIIALACTILLYLYTGNIFAQKRVKAYENYIAQFKKTAQHNQALYNIPASITLAQGLLESAAGKSELSQRSNNHFGIKCHTDWRGKRTYAKDDSPNDCFRVYNHPEESYRDHALFLQRPRYQPLFSLSITDYRSWARGLQQAGYATDRAYANKLIKLIEDYELFMYDTPANKKQLKHHRKYTGVPHTPYRTHGLVYVIARRGDTFQDIADEFDFKVKKLYKYNEVPEDFPLNDGDIVYLQRKKSRADRPYFEHVIQIGESMHSIAQLYGMRVKNLYKLNKLSGEYIPQEGDVLRLR